MSGALADIAAVRQRDFRRMVALSAALHAALGLVAMVELPRGEVELPAGPPIQIITPAELATRLGRTTAPTPEPVEPQPEPEPEPVVVPPPPPEPDKIVIPEDTHRKPAPPKPKPAREAPSRPPPPQQVEQVALEDLLLEERILSGAMPGARPQPVETRAQPAAGAGGTGAPLSPEVAAWHQKVRAHVRRTLNLPPGYRGKSLRTHVVISLTSSGDIVGFEVERGSGNPWYDELIERYLAKETALPPPPRGGDWPFIFDGDY
jgi:outer membrane biosynthesis protein TonB